MAVSPRAQSGRKAQQNGDGFERALNNMNLLYGRRSDPRVWWARLGPPMRARSVGGRVSFFPEKEGPPDYLAVCGPYTYLFEAKATQEAAWPLGMLEEHQAQQLTDAEKAGKHVIAGVLVQISRVGIWWLPWRSLGPLWWRWNSVARAKPGEGALTPDDCDRIGRRCVGMDWLSAAGAAYLEGK